MGLVRWMTQNVCDTEGPTHPDVVALPTTLPPGEAVGVVADLVGCLRRWTVLSIEGNVIRATHRTVLWRFTDDIVIRVVPNTDGSGSRIHARSQSRLGKGDLGQNRRNLRELFRALRKGLPVP
jgi:uncharacterized protein (DUF1499 family)